MQILTVCFFWCVIRGKKRERNKRKEIGRSACFSWLREAQCVTVGSLYWNPERERERETNNFLTPLSLSVSAHIQVWREFKESLNLLAQPQTSVTVCPDVCFRGSVALYHLEVWGYEDEKWKICDAENVYLLLWCVCAVYIPEWRIYVIIYSPSCG